MIPQRIVLAAIVAVGLAGSAVGQNFSPTTPPPGSAAPTPPARRGGLQIGRAHV